MKKWNEILDTFILQAKDGGLKTSSYPKDYSDLKMKVSFGMGMAARVPWISFLAPEMQTSKGFYPVYLFYKEENILILAYGISETSEYSSSWPMEITDSSTTIESYFDKKVPRYNDSYVYRSYELKIDEDKVEYSKPNTNEIISEKDLESDLSQLLNKYKNIVDVEVRKEDSLVGQGLFYMEKQLEDFIIHNWDSTELGDKYDLIVEEGDMVSQQYKTDIGFIDILAKDKIDGSYVVIELKKNQTSDDTVGQIARYMGWIKQKKNDEKVKGIIIAGEYDKKLEYALQIVTGIEVFLYKVDFKLNKFR